MDARGEKPFDVAIVGGGIVGLSSALAVADRYPDKRILVLEKEQRVGSHQTGHNSGVVHSGVYYAPGSLKARLTRRGNNLLKAFCSEHGIEYDECGKVIVASNDEELPRLQALYERGLANEVPGIRLIDAAELRQIEPKATGVMAIHCPHTAIVDYGQVSEKLTETLIARGVEVRTGAGVTGISEQGDTLQLTGTAWQVSARFLVNCAGLHSDRVAELAGVQPSVRIVPFRGEYYMLRSSSSELVRGLIYPVPDPRLPFLGVHFTKTVHGGIEAGPNAVLALAREGYGALDVRLADIYALATYSGFWRLAAAYWRVGAFEAYRSLSKAAFVRSLKKLVPAIDGNDLTRGPTGVRAQAVGKDGKLVDDFVIHASSTSLHVLNAPSPAATAGLAIGEYIAHQVNLA